MLPLRLGVRREAQEVGVRCPKAVVLNLFGTGTGFQEDSHRLGVIISE